MKKTNCLCLTAALCCLFGVGSGRAAQMTMEFPLATPKFESLSGGPLGTVPAVHLEFKYDAKGKIQFLPNSTVGTNVLTGTTTITKSTREGFKYSILAKGASNRTVSLTLKGALTGNVASCTYVVGKTRVITNLPVVISQVFPVKASFTLNSQTDSKGKVTGTGSIVSGFGNDSTAVGVLKGRLTKSRLTWQLKQGAQQLTFTGKNRTNEFPGTLTVSLPPERGSYKNFVFPGFSKPPGGGGTGNATFAGTVTESSSQGGPPSGSFGVQVTVRSDLNGNGISEANETVTTQTDTDGKYSVSAAVLHGGRTVVEFAQEGFAKVLKVVDPVRTNATVVHNVALRPLSQLSITGSDATSSDGKLQVKGLPATVKSVQARVFNPVTEADHFPGEFADDQKNVLISSVFSVIDARDGSGKPVTSLGAGSTLKMQVPRDTWGTMRDLRGGNGQIDVPLYYFDEGSGQWKRSSSDGWLEDSAGAKIVENRLTSIRDGTYAGTVFVAAPITHLSYWNCDWPVETHTCLRGVVVDSANVAVAGASVQIRGVSYNGTTSPKVTDADGSFCAEVMRSEGAGEDVNGNGVAGETQSVNVTVFSGGKFYRFGPYPTPVAQATCDQGNCLDLGNLQLSEANRLSVSVCTVTGTFTYSGSTQPVPGAAVYGWDESLEPEAWWSYYTNGASFFGTTDANGSFTLHVPLLSGVTLWSAKSDSIGTNSYENVWGTASVASCPVNPITIEGDWSRWFGLKGTGIDSGDVYQLQGTISAWFSKAPDYYSAVVPSGSQVQFPSKDGESMTLDLYRYGSSGPIGKVGTITFSVVGDSGGTWQTSTGLSGTWGY